MIQILGLRRYHSKKTNKEEMTDTFHDKYWRSANLPTLFKDLDSHLGVIPEEERWNLFYTISECGEGKREFKQLGVMAYDIDKIDTDKIADYIEAICPVLGVKADDIAIVSSGHGLHFLIELSLTITDKNYFAENRGHYKYICLKINKALAKAKLKGSADSSVFNPRALLRLPKTINRKPGKEDVMCRFVSNGMKPLSHDIRKLSGMPQIAQGEQISKEDMKSYPTPDKDAVLAGCGYLKWMKKEPEGVNEPQWYAGLSILARIDTKVAHAYSEDHNGYTVEETDLKIEQALAASGPRTCKNIEQLWEGCSKCPNYGKVKSPLLIQGEDHIGTEANGFHIVIAETGKRIPHYQDLLKCFKRKHPFVGLDGSRMVQTWNGSHYEYMPNVFIEQFAQLHFKPAAKSAMVREFRELVCRTNLKQQSWFEDTTDRKMNFLNGMLDLDTMAFGPHTPEFGFRHVLPYDYKPLATAPNFVAMLERITGGDSDIQKVLLEFMGYALSNDRYWAHKALVLVGDGANGKSTFLNTLKALVGEGNYSCLVMKELTGEYNRQMLDGKLLNVAEETPTKAMLDSSMFKNLTAGGELQVRAPYKEPYMIKNKAKMAYSCNGLPESEDTSQGFFRRLLIVPFNQVFTKKDAGYDPRIEEKLLLELPGIFNLAMEGYHRLVAQEGFTEASVLVETLEQYKHETNTVLSWARDNLTVHSNGGFEQNFTAMADAYASYVQECKNSGFKAVTMTMFSKELKKFLGPTQGPEERFVRKYSEKSKRQERGLQGISLH